MKKIFFFFLLSCFFSKKAFALNIKIREFIENLLENENHRNNFLHLTLSAIKKSLEQDLVTNHLNIRNGIYQVINLHITTNDEAEIPSTLKTIKDPNQNSNVTPQMYGIAFLYFFQFALEENLKNSTDFNTCTEMRNRNIELKDAFDRWTYNPSNESVFKEFMTIINICISTHQHTIK